MADPPHSPKTEDDAGRAPHRGAARSTSRWVFVLGIIIAIALIGVMVFLRLAERTAGEALVFGHPYRELSDPARRVGAVLESSDFHPGRSGRDHLRSLALAAEIVPTRVEEVLALVELEAAADRRVKTY